MEGTRRGCIAIKFIIAQTNKKHSGNYGCRFLSGQIANLLIEFF